MSITLDGSTYSVTLARRIEKCTCKLSQCDNYMIKYAMTI